MEIIRVWILNYVVLVFVIISFNYLFLQNFHASYHGFNLLCVFFVKIWVSMKSFDLVEFIFVEIFVVEF